jgi:hypothetical protein
MRFLEQHFRAHRARDTKAIDLTQFDFFDFLPKVLHRQLRHNQLLYGEILALAPA